MFFYFIIFQINFPCDISIELYYICTDYFHNTFPLLDIKDVVCLFVCISTFRLIQSQVEPKVYYIFFFFFLFLDSLYLLRLERGKGHFSLNLISIPTTSYNRYFSLINIAFTNQKKKKKRLFFVSTKQSYTNLSVAKLTTSIQAYNVSSFSTFVFSFLSLSLINQKSINNSESIYKFFFLSCFLKNK